MGDQIGDLECAFVDIDISQRKYLALSRAQARRANANLFSFYYSAGRCSSPSIASGSFRVSSAERRGQYPLHADPWWVNQSGDDHSRNIIPKSCVI